MLEILHMDFDASKLLQKQERIFDDALRQENLQLKLKIRELEMKLQQIHHLTSHQYFTDKQETGF